jgi:hypothetical protein
MFKTTLTAIAMPSIKYIPILAVAALFVGQPANAQYTYINPNVGGGYTITTPGAANPYTYVNPNIGGGYTITTPGATNPYTYVNPNVGGGWTVTTPGYNPYRYR